MNQYQSTPSQFGESLIEACLELFNRHLQKTRTELMTTGLILHFIARPRRLPAASLHDTVECLEIRPPLPVCEEPRGFKGRDLFGDRGSHELVDGGSILSARPLNGLLQGGREP
jgi:hypothetical protein